MEDLKILKEIRRKIGSEGIKQLSMLDAIVENFGNKLSDSNLSLVMEMVNDCYTTDDDNDLTFGDYAYCLKTYMDKNDKTIRDRDTFSQSELNDIIDYEYRQYC